VRVGRLPSPEPVGSGVLGHRGGGPLDPALRGVRGPPLGQRRNVPGVCVLVVRVAGFNDHTSSRPRPDQQQIQRSGLIGPDGLTVMAAMEILGESTRAVTLQGQTWLRGSTGWNVPGCGGPPSGGRRGNRSHAITGQPAPRGPGQPWQPLGAGSTAPPGAGLQVENDLLDRAGERVGARPP
jgi:hypothetical protein